MPFRDDVVDDLVSWDEVEDLLRDDWQEVHDRSSGLTITRLDDLLVDEPASATAAQRRRLHRAGFRRVRDGDRCWSWTAPEPTRPVVPLPATSLPRLRESLERGLRAMARDRARSAMVLRVLRDVFRCQPHDLTLVIVVEEDWDEDDDEPWLPSGDCATVAGRLPGG